MKNKIIPPLTPQDYQLLTIIIQRASYAMSGPEVMPFVGLVSKIYAATEEPEPTTDVPDKNKNLAKKS